MTAEAQTLANFHMNVYTHLLCDILSKQVKQMTNFIESSGNGHSALINTCNHLQR